MVENLERLLDVSRQLAETRSMDTLLDYAVDVAMELFGAEYAYLILLDENDSLDFRVKRTKSGKELEEPEAQISQTILNKVIREGQDLIIADALSDEAYQQSHSVVILQIRSVLCVPLIARGNILGALYLENRSVVNRFTEDDVKPLKLFASQAAVAIENTSLYEELESRVRTRTAELEARTEELDAFAHSVAHDLRSPLTSIVGYAQILQEDYLDLPEEQIQTYLRSIVRSGLKMSGIIDALLLLASVRKKESPSEPLNTAWIIADVLDRLGDIIEAYQAEILLPDRWPIALGHQAWIEEVWINYISNALKYGGRPPRIELGATTSGGMVLFWVRDNGPGLSPEEQSRLFKPFTRLHQVEAEGQGLGLSIVRRIVEKLGGQVSVRSQVGEGSVFSFTLPAHKEADCAQE